MQDTFPIPMRVRPLRIACIGEAMVELSFPAGETGAPEIGYSGDTLNTAIYLKRKIADWCDVAFLTALGTDRFSDQMVDFMIREALQTETISRLSDRLPGLYAIVTDSEGERSFNYWRDSSAARFMFETVEGPDFSRLAAFDVIYFSAISLAILPVKTRGAFLAWIEAARSRGDCVVAFDSNYRPGLWADVHEARHWTEKAWRVTDIALPSADDEMALFNDASPEAVLSRLAGYGLKVGVLKNGAAGPISFQPVADLPKFQPADKVVDTTAAGDSFNGAFLAAIFSGKNLADAMISGHQCAARVVGFAGAFEKPGR